MSSVAVILSGCGRSDGSEITEAVSCLIHLDRHGAAYRCFAPDRPQADVVNHATGAALPEKRNIMVESARISRGQIEPLSALRAEAFDALVLPGGFGAAKNLCTFASEGAGCSVDPEVERAFRGFHNARKPIALCCIAPVIAARLLGKAAGGAGCTITIGPDAEAAEAVSRMGSTNIARGVTEAVVDPANRIVTTPAYMCESGPFGVFTGIGRMIDEMVKLVR